MAFANIPWFDLDKNLRGMVPDRSILILARHTKLTGGDSMI